MIEGASILLHMLAKEVQKNVTVDSRSMDWNGDMKV